MNVSSSAYVSLEVLLRHVYSKSAIWIVIILFITKDFTQKWSQIFLHTGVVTINYSQRGDSVLYSPQLFIRRMRLTDSMIFTKSFLPYMRMRLTIRLYGIDFA